MLKAKTGAVVRKVILVDDHPILRQGIGQVIEDEPDLTICGEAADAETAMRLSESEQPDVAIIDITLRDGNGIELIRRLLARWPKLAVLVLSMYNEPFYAEQCFRAGAKGYVTKGEPCQQIVKGIREVLRGEVFISEKLAAKMVDKLVGGRRDGERRSIDRLSDREFQIFEMIGQGMHTRDIAGKLSLSIKTVDAHRENIKGKLKLRNATELLKTAIQWTQFERRV